VLKDWRVCQKYLNESLTGGQAGQRESRQAMLQLEDSEIRVMKTYLVKEEKGDDEGYGGEEGSDEAWKEVRILAPEAVSEHPGKPLERTL
jgi:hypothetical protein